MTPSELREEIEIFNYWQFGDWIKLSQLDTLNKCDEYIAYKACAQFQLGKLEAARLTMESLSGSVSHDVKRILLSGVFNSLGKLRHILNDFPRSDLHFAESVNVCTFPDISVHAVQARKAEQLAQLNFYSRWVCLDSINNDSSRKKLFIDCGGHDGCSVIKFKLSNPSYDIITFEGNPELWPYYEKLPTELIKKLAYDYNGDIEFIIDPVDADGSSVIKEKNIDFYKKIKNEDCPVIITPCLDLSEFIAKQALRYDEIILKLDVEGAEYCILKKMLNDGTVKYIKKLYAEFHWNKINFPKDEHDRLVNQLMNYFEIEEWDAAEFQIHTRSAANYKVREQIISCIN